MTSLSLSFREWSYPNKHRKIECCAFGECGFLAYSRGTTVTIYSNEIGCFSPMYMWSPFEHNVTCMGWYDGSCTPSIVQPLLAIGSKTGKMAVFDVRNRNILGYAQFKGDKLRSILWSPFYRSRFFVGSTNGNLYSLQMDDDTHDIAIRAELNLGFQVDFIASDPQTGTTIAAASKDGRFTIISSILTAKSTDKFQTYNLKLSNNESITTLNFFPDHPNFLIISTTQTSYLFSVNEQFTLPYIQTEGIRFISSPSKSTNRIIIGYDDSISLWQYNDEGWTRLYLLNFVQLKGTKAEAKLYTSLDDKVIVFTESNWLTVIEERNNKLFVAQRIRMMPSKPLDWDFRKGSIAFANQCGSVLVTSWTPDAIIQSKSGFGEEVSMDDLASNSRRLNSDAGLDDLKFILNFNDDENGKEYNIDEYNTNDEYLNNTDSSSSAEFGKPSSKRTPHFVRPKVDQTNGKKTFSQLMDSNELEVDVDQGAFENEFDFSTSFVSVPASTIKNASFVRRSSKDIRDDVSKIWGQLNDSCSINSDDQQVQPLLTLPAEVNLDDQEPLSAHHSRKIWTKTHGEPICGNSNTLLLCFNVTNFPLDHVMWGPGGRLIVWAFHDNKNTLQLVDFKKRESKPLLSMQLNAITVPITRIFFSEDRSIFCIIIDGQTALFMSIASTPKQIGSLNFPQSVIGSFGPNNNTCYFISKDAMLYQVSVNPKDGASIKQTFSFPSKRGEPTFISVIQNGIIIGTSIGKVCMYYGLEYSEYRSILRITNPVELVCQCENNSYFIMDNQHNGMIHKVLEDIPIKGYIKNVKQASSSTFLMKIAGNGKLTVLSTTGKFTPLPPPCVSRCPLVQGSERYQKEFRKLKLNSADEAIKACRLFGVIFIMRLIQAKQNPNSLSEHVSWLNGLISGCVQFSSWAISLALKIGDNISARNILLMTSPTSPDFLRNMTKAALFDAQSAGESVKLVTRTLFNIGKKDEAIDILLITGDINGAVKMLCDQDKIRDAAMLLRMRRDKKKHLDLYHAVASKLIEQRKLMLGLLMLSEGGFNGEMVGLISSIIGVEFSHIVSFLDEEDVHY